MPAKSCLLLHGFIRGRPPISAPRVEDLHLSLPSDLSRLMKSEAAHRSAMADRACMPIYGSACDVSRMSCFLSPSLMLASGVC